MSAPRPFRIEIPQTQIDDLHRRIDAMIWPDELPDAEWDYGMPLSAVQELAAHWRDGYDWRLHEARLNAIPQYTAAIDGQRVHFLHVRSPHEGALPLVLTHGWPGSVIEFLETIGPLTDPPASGGDAADAFDVVIPSIPGYGFSGPTRERGWDVARVAAAWRELMALLGYERYGAQGGDWGAAISRELGRIDPEHAVGVHLNFLPTAPDGEPLDDEERNAIQRLRTFQQTGSGYMAIHRTRPQTLAYAMHDSPVGLLAWIAEKLYEWSDPASTIAPDTILTNVMLYWLTGTANSAMRMYHESLNPPARPLPSPTPTGIAVFPHEIAPPIRSIATQTNPIVHWSQMLRGGHFAALEVPELLVPDVRAFFRGLR